ncbi:MAG: hypothetical protein HY554_06940 [Elusimicrobia bacterium]|nr:hypothetical protein [Elusimicrobiota bacterium]
MTVERSRAYAAVLSGLIGLAAAAAAGEQASGTKKVVSVAIGCTESEIAAAVGGCSAAEPGCGETTVGLARDCGRCAKTAACMDIPALACRDASQSCATTRDCCGGLFCGQAGACSGVTCGQATAPCNGTSSCCKNFRCTRNRGGTCYACSTNRCDGENADSCCDGYACTKPYPTSGTSHCRLATPASACGGAGQPCGGGCCSGLSCDSGTGRCVEPDLPRASSCRAAGSSCELKRGVVDGSVCCPGSYCLNVAQWGGGRNFNCVPYGSAAWEQPCSESRPCWQGVCKYPPIGSAGWGVCSAESSNDED